MKNSQRIFSLAQFSLTLESIPMHKRIYGLYKLRHVRYEFMKANGIRCRRVYGTPKDWR